MMENHNKISFRVKIFSSWRTRGGGWGCTEFYFRHAEEYTAPKACNIQAYTLQQRGTHSRPFQFQFLVPSHKELLYTLAVCRYCIWEESTHSGVEGRAGSLGLTIGFPHIDQDFWSGEQDWAGTGTGGPSRVEFHREFYWLARSSACWWPQECRYCRHRVWSDKQLAPA